ncbi:response regulator [Cribrihabitans neustonicus]|uniref:response regulator n=1 Tax=Cribrihabitans neustonicus TaxID=1429085 RepID=UPI003B5977A2
MNGPSQDQPAIGRVVVVDDDRADQIFYRRIIRRSKLADDIIMFDYAEEALEFLSGDDCPPVDVILLDINMPRMNGFEFLEEACRRLGPDLGQALVVMLTSSLDPRDLQRAQRFEAVKGYLSKPLTVDCLQRISDLLAGKLERDAGSGLLLHQ